MPLGETVTVPTTIAEEMIVVLNCDRVGLSKPSLRAPEVWALTQVHDVPFIFEAKTKALEHCLQPYLKVSA